MSKKNFAHWAPPITNVHLSSRFRKSSCSSVGREWVGSELMMAMKKLMMQNGDDHDLDFDDDGYDHDDDDGWQ